MKKLKCLVLCVLIGTSTLTLVGCKDKFIIQDNPSTNSGIYNFDNVNIDKNKDYLAIGEILSFDENNIHIINKNMVEIYEVSNNVEKYYVGQRVKVKKVDNQYFVEEEIIEDMNLRFNSMDQPINTVRGTVKRTSEDIVVLDTEHGDMLFLSYEASKLKPGTMITIDYHGSENINFMDDYYDPQTIMELVIQDIMRDEKGNMILSTKDFTQEKKIKVMGSINFNYSELKVGDQIKIYPRDIVGEIIIPKKIEKQSLSI